MSINPRSKQYRRGDDYSVSYWWHTLVVFVTVGILSVFPLSARPLEDRTFPAKHVVVIDADTIAYGSLRIRLKGISAPERGHHDYGAGREYLVGLIAASEKVHCNLTGETTYRRRVARCQLIDVDEAVVDMQRAIVSSGHARGCPRYGGWRYILDEVGKSRSLPFPVYCWGFSV